jgi:site-specific DNA recombinase
MSEMEKLHSWTAEVPTPERWYAFYVRVTQEESVTADLSIPNQIARARELAAVRGWNDYRIYVEPRHVSAKLWIEKRPALKELLDDVAAGRIIGVCARHTDRLWRNSRVQGRILDALRVRRVDLWDFAHQYDYKSAHGRFSLQVLGAASELEVNLTSERIREMKRGKALKGKTGGGTPPFGYTSQARRIHELEEAGHTPDEAYRQACLEFPVGKCWYIDEKEAEVVRLVFELYTSPQYRYGCKRIVQYLNERGYKRRGGSVWLFPPIMRMINNPVYAGFTTFDEEAYKDRLPSQQPRHRQARFKAEHEPIVSAEVWEKAQQIKVHENTIKRQRPGKAPTEASSLTGILRCPRCGSHMLGKRNTVETARRYYICSKRHLGGPDICSFPLVDARGVQRAVWNWLHEIVASPDFVMEHTARLNQKLEVEQPEAERRLAGFERRRDEIKSALAKYFGLFEASQDPERDAAFLERVRELRAELKAVEVEVAAVKAQVSPAPRKFTVERVRQYLDKLRAKVDERPEYQRVVFQEFRRDHDLKVHAVTHTEFTVSLALPTAEMAEEGTSSRLFGVLAGTSSSRGSEVSLSPLRVSARNRKE